MRQIVYAYQAVDD